MCFLLKNSNFFINSGLTFISLSWKGSLNRNISAVFVVPEGRSIKIGKRANLTLMCFCKTSSIVVFLLLLIMWRHYDFMPPSDWYCCWRTNSIVTKIWAVQRLITAPTRRCSWQNVRHQPDNRAEDEELYVYIYSNKALCKGHVHIWEDCSWFTPLPSERWSSLSGPRGLDKEHRSKWKLGLSIPLPPQNR